MNTKKKYTIIGVCREDILDIACMLSQTIIQYGPKITKLKLDAKSGDLEIEMVEGLI